MNSGGKTFRKTAALRDSLDAGFSGRIGLCVLGWEIFSGCVCAAL